jgi:dephospho-CoA kinase
MIKALNIPLIDADDVVYYLYKNNHSVLTQITALTTHNITHMEGGVDRHKLSLVIKKNLEILIKIEAIVHPAVRESIQKWLKKQYSQQEKYVVLSIPLMFDAGFDSLCDVIMCCHSNDKVRKERFMERNLSSDEKLQLITSKQLSNAEYIKKSDYSIPTDKTIEETQRTLNDVLNTVKKTPAKAYTKKWNIA